MGSTHGNVGNLIKLSGSEKLAHLIEHPESHLILRGELWIAPEVLTLHGFSRGPKGLTELSASIRADLCFFPWTDLTTPSDLEGLINLARVSGLGYGLTLDGPFERLTKREDLFTLLRILGTEPLRFYSQLTEEAEKIAEEIEMIKGSEVALIVLCDDLAYNDGLYFSTQAFLEYLLPSYRRLVSQISSTHAVPGWHSDGNVSAILPELVNCGFRFFSLEAECVDLLDFKHAYANRVTLVGGLRTAWLLGGPVDQRQEQECFQEIKLLTKQGGFILASSCGLFDPKALPVLRTIYGLVDKMAVSPSEIGSPLEKGWEKGHSGQ
jgi:hypothetical protein